MTFADEHNVSAQFGGEVTLEVEVLRRRSKGDNGGGIFWGECIYGRKYAVALNFKQLPNYEHLHPGQIWFVSGPVKSVLVKKGGYTRRENWLSAEEAYALKPSQPNLARWISGSPACKGIGSKKVWMLTKEFGDSLIEIIRARDVAALSRVLTPEASETLCDALLAESKIATISWLDSVGLKPNVATKILNFYGDQAEKKITGNPYRMLSFESQWNRVDHFARERVGVKINDTRRLCAAVEEALYRILKTGSTCASRTQVKRKLVDSILGDSKLSESALTIAAESGNVVEHDQMLATTGSWLIERSVAQYIELLAGAKMEASQLQLSNKHPSIDATIAKFEVEEGYELTAEQKDAVRMAATNKLCLIIGGAGTGKTTVLKCLYQVINASEPFAQIYQMALAGKAALRMTDATARPASTICAFTKNNDQDNIPPGSWIVIDESSMVDVLSFANILSRLPSGCRIVLVGDPYQLPPVGPGKVLNALVDLPSLGRVELKVVKRQSGKTGIPLVAGNVREGKWPEIGVSEVGDLSAEEGVFFINSGSPLDTVVDLYGRLLGLGSVQIIAPLVKACDELNVRCQEKYNSSSEIASWHSDVNLSDKIAFGRYRVGDPVIFKINDYDRDLRNGSMGLVSAVHEAREAQDTLCTISFEGNSIEANQSDLQNVSLAYAITVHKSQGSQWDRVLMPVMADARNVERSMLYTAITRSVKQIVLVGCQEAVRNAVKRVAVDDRAVNLGKLLAARF
ncbi:AAA family ATPase [Congregibacter litoralis]|uniref:ATP-dependent exoDNAse (Exonuclease V), alpha subunit-helicase superfamily I member n=1 Tax=Congregibacter litoralis KT71 TaxID=314285 RepID=A4A3A3_9GAMM|nr:AAA family ATPase [Congregibacter litoralis]EAQ99176.1 ATP-dependent exoDNAse (exonuclease V), alpha subunit - helicase superfamily I member [Congregibacter litoralis KT71]